MKDFKKLSMYDENIETTTSNNVISWVAVGNGLPNELETVWISNGKGWTTLGCIAYAEGVWHWAQTNGVIYQQDGKIVSECESDDLDVKFWHRLPEPIMTNEQGLKSKEKALHIGGVISRLYDLEKTLYENANKNPNDFKDFLASGKQQAYSHIYFEVKNIIKELSLKTLLK